MATKPTAIPLADLNIVEAPDDAHWERWLEAHHATAADAWVKIAKKGSGVTTVHYPEVLDTAICFGWIDAVRRPLDEPGVADVTQADVDRRADVGWALVEPAPRAAGVVQAEGANGRPVGDEPLHEVAADEPVGAGDEDGHTRQ